MRHLVLTVLSRHARIPKSKIVNVERLYPYDSVQLRTITPTHFHTSSIILNSNRKSQSGEKNFEEDEDNYDADDAAKSALATQTYFNSDKRNKETYEVMLEIYKKKNVNRKGVVEFIYAALKHMDDYKVSYDIQTYKKLIELMPEGKYVPENFYSEAFYHYPKQQDCIGRLLDQMELKGLYHNSK